MNESTTQQQRMRVAVLWRISMSGPLAPGEKELLSALQLEFLRMMPNDNTTCRYYADHAGWRVDMMDGGRSPPLRGEIGSYPEWLAVILDVAKIGGHIAVWEGPDKRPTQTMWFRIDTHHQLVEFVDWMK